MASDRLQRAILELLDDRRDGATICPSEAARAVGGERWRDLMDDARAAAAALDGEGRIEVLQRGRRVDALEARGPIRLRAAPPRDAARTRGAGRKR